MHLKSLHAISRFCNVHDLHFVHRECLTAESAPVLEKKTIENALGSICMPHENRSASGPTAGSLARAACNMTLGRAMYRSLLQINKQYELKRIPITGVVGFTGSRFSNPPMLRLREAFDAKEADFDGELPFCRMYGRNVLP